YQLDVFDPRGDRKGAPLQGALDGVERVSHSTVADRVDRDRETGLPGPRATRFELRAGDDLHARARIVFIPFLQKGGSRSECPVREKLHRADAHALVPPSTTEFQVLRGLELRRGHGEEEPERQPVPVAQLL